MPTHLLTLDEAAARLRKTPAAFRWLRATGNAPLAVKIGGRLYFREADVEAFIDDNTEKAS